MKNFAPPEDPQIIKAPARHLVGLSMTTRLAENAASALWRAFKPRVREINGRISTDFFSVQICDDLPGIAEMTPNTQFRKWAAVEVGDAAAAPQGMESLRISAGMYAVFIYRGLPQDFPQTAAYIFGEWLPRSGYRLADRPQFEIMGANYRYDDSEAREEIWVPIDKHVVI